MITFDRFFSFMENLPHVPNSLTNGMGYLTPIEAENRSFLVFEGRRSLPVVCWEDGRDVLRKCFFVCKNSAYPLDEWLQSGKTSEKVCL